MAFSRYGPGKGRKLVKTRQKITKYTLHPRVRAARATALQATTVRNRTQVKLGLGLPKRAIVTHKYSESITLTSTLGTLALHLFSCNGMTDPNISGAGHQPMYYDQFTALYDHYTVIGSKIKYRICTNSPTLSMLVGAMINDDTTTTVTSISGIDEASLGKTRLIPAGMDVPTVITQKWSAKKFFPGSVLANNSLQGSGANPTEQSYFAVYLQDPTATQTVACTVQVEIEYIAVWNELKDLAQS